MDRTGSVQEEEKDGYGRFRLGRREVCIGQVEIKKRLYRTDVQVQVKEKRRMDKTGSGQREEKDEQERFMLDRREKCI